jgi:hypothetical protein
LLVSTSLLASERDDGRGEECREENALPALPGYQVKVWTKGTAEFRTKFVPGTIYTEAPDDSGVSSFVGTLDPATGIIKPVVIGLSKATGLIFIPDGDEE